MEVEIGRALGVPFKEPQWPTRAALGGVWYMVPFLGFVVQGYSLDYMRWVAHGRELPLPDWSQFGRYWIRGLLVGVGSLIYALPGIILFMVGIFPVIAAAVSENEMVLLGGFGSMCFIYALATIYLIAISVFIGAAIANYAMSESFSAFFAVSDIWNMIKNNASQYFTAWGMTLVFGIAAGTLVGTVTGILSILPFVGTLAGMFVGGFIGYLVVVMSAHLYGQYCAEAYGMAGLAPLPQPTYSPPPTPDATEQLSPPPPPLPPQSQVPQTPTEPDARPDDDATPPEG